MKKYEPFDGNQSISIADLTIENSEDKLVIYGDLEITRDKEGLEKLNKLLSIFEATKEKLLKEQLPEKIDNKESLLVKNPFKK